MKEIKNDAGARVWRCAGAKIEEFLRIVLSGQGEETGLPFQKRSWKGGYLRIVGR